MSRAESATTTADQTGVEAERPREIPRRGWLEIAKRGWREAREDQVPMLAAGVAFYAFLAIWPALIALVLLYGLIADPATIADQVDSAADAVPGAVRDLVVTQLRSIASTHQVGASIGLVISVVLALWSASSGMSNLITAVNTAYDEEETRSFVRKRLLALGITLGAVLFMIVMLGLVAVLPIVFSATEGPLRWLAEVIRWVLIAALVSGALAVLYRLAPDRDAPKFRWVSVGAVIATVLWLLASVGFSVYVSVAGNYAKTYGSLASIVILLFWLWITAYAVLLGAEINAESEEQTARDTTHGPAQPIGERGAVKADSVPPDSPVTTREGTDMSTAKPDRPTEPERTRGPDSTRAASASAPAIREETTAVASQAGDTASPSVAALIQQVTEESSRLVRGEIRLAQAELTEKAKHAGLGLGAFGVAGVLAWFAIGALLTTAVLALSLVLPAWAAALIVSVVIIIAAGVAALVGRKQVRSAAPPVPTETVASVKADVNEIKESVRR